jgi:hypothetical protein
MAIINRTANACHHVKGHVIFRQKSNRKVIQRAEAIRVKPRNGVCLIDGDSSTKNIEPDPFPCIPCFPW